MQFGFYSCHVLPKYESRLNPVKPSASEQVAMTIIHVENGTTRSEQNRYKVMGKVRQGVHTD